ncbi:metallophosphoesterase [Thiolapillus sp.]
MENGVLEQLEQRLGRVHARQRLGIEADNEPRVFGTGLNFFHPENWYSFHSLLRYALRLTGLYRRGWRNTLNIQLRHNRVEIPGLPPAFEGFTLLHLSDLHADMNPPAMQALGDVVAGLEYDLCVLTGDYRAQTYGSGDAALKEIGALCSRLSGPIYGILGNHDSIRMLPGMEDLGVRMLLNEQVEIRRGEAAIHLAGIDDAHYYRVDNVEKAALDIDPDAVSILLSHTPEIYRQATHAGFDLMLCGHTHGGQICLPGGIPITLDSNCPRYMGAGAWRYRQMQGYTSVGAGTCIVEVRFNCLPEVTLHHLHAAQ